jgi:hypothetical protein
LPPPNVQTIIRQYNAKTGPEQFDRMDATGQSAELARDNNPYLSGEPQGQRADGGGGAEDRCAEERDASAGRPRLAAGAQALYRADPWDDEAARFEENLNAVEVAFSPQDLRQIDEVFDRIEVQGSRYAAATQAQVDRR